MELKFQISLTLVLSSAIIASLAEDVSLSISEPEGSAINPQPPASVNNIPQNQNGINSDNNYDPMTFQYTPRKNSQRGVTEQPYIITEARLREIRSEFMYPYYDRGVNNATEDDYQKHIQSSRTQVHKNLNFQLPFFGFRYNYTRVSVNGYLEFSDPPPNYQYPLVFPVKEWPEKNDPAFIGIFFSKCKIGNLKDEDVDRREPGVYFRLERDLPNRVDQMGVEIRERVKWDIRTGIIGSDSFNPKHAIIATWKNVSFNGGFSGSAIYRTNTFQMVLVTDEVFTYAIFNYLNLDWTSHTEAGGDTLTGEGGVPALVGFNAGSGIRSYDYMPYSQRSTIRDLTTGGYGNMFQGRHIFRFDENILAGSCNSDIDGANLPLVIAPESGNMLGGTIVNITGPCFDPADQILCKFDVADVVYGVVVDTNRAICVQPSLFVEGYVRLEIAIGQGTFKWKGKYYVETPAQATQKIFFEDMKEHEKSPAEIKMTWEQSNLTTNQNAQIHLSLWGYRENTTTSEIIFISVLEDNAVNSGKYTIIPALYKNRSDESLTDIRFGFIQINLTEPIPVGTEGIQSSTITPAIWSRPIPLGWYFGPQWEDLYGEQWTSYLCDEWITEDKYLKNFTDELPQCPCTLEQALADKGRFRPDPDCDKASNPQCYYNKQAIHCVITGSPTMEGGEQQCCYDRNNSLMLSNDQQLASSPRRCHNLGYSPYDEATKVPTLSQWHNDIAPRYFCCLWQEEQESGCETLKFERRPSQDCLGYQLPVTASVYGDVNPHIVTFDNIDYMFKAFGEFVLLKSTLPTNNLEVQGKFEKISSDVRDTKLTSIVAKGNLSTVVEVRIRPQESRWRYRLDVIANARRVYFDNPSLKFQHFPGVTVYTPTYILNQSEVIIMFDNGAGVEVIEKEGFMSARVYLPQTFINNTLGLFGNWSVTDEDEFTLSDDVGTNMICNVNDIKTICDEFELKWKLDDVFDENKGRSLFLREFGKTSATYDYQSETKWDSPDVLASNNPEEILP